MYHLLKSQKNNQLKPRITLKSGGGFTIVEVLVATFIITVGITGVLIAIQQAMAYIDLLFPRLTAIYLVQEGIEIVRNVRDTNWLQSRSATSTWDDGICSSPPCEWEADYTTVTFAPTFYFETCDSAGHNCDAYDDEFLLLNGGFYNYSSGDPTRFKRKIIISDKQDLDGDSYADQMRVEVKVGWEAKGYHEISAEEILYNWRE
jgi:hypothetical protein